jgi:erythronate-4-phosphate dehydrogenase
MKFIIDSNIPFGDTMFRDCGVEVTIATGDAITRELVKDADGLLVRSITRVDDRLLSGSSVKFVGTATVGADHVDVPYLESRGIGFAAAPGSNANSVSEYVIAALLTLADRFNLQLDRMSIGVVGVGNVGIKVVEKCSAVLGMRVLQNDPPRARSTGSPEFLSLDELMEVDVVSLHVPLTRTGDDRTFHLFDDERITKLKSGSMLINTARGAVVETGALRQALQSGRLHAAVLDVWENEPVIDLELLSLVAIGTPHIAGYSSDGKMNGARMVYNAVCDFFNLPKTWSVDGLLPPSDHPEVIADPSVGSHQGVLRAIVKQCYPIEHDDERLREVFAIPSTQCGDYFRLLRNRYPIRREFAATTVRLKHEDASLRRKLVSLGFRVAPITDSFVTNAGSYRPREFAR